MTDKYELNLQDIVEKLEIVLFEMQIGKKVEFTALDGKNMALLVAKVKQQNNRIEKLENQLKIERKNFDYLEKAVDKSFDSGRIFTHFHQIREYEEGDK
jgi:hypothetical protein